MTVKTPFFGSFNKVWQSVESVGARHRVIREFWAAILPEESVPDSVPLDMLNLRLSYEFLAMDHAVAKVPLPEKCRINLEASRQYNVKALNKNMRGLMETSLNTERGGHEDMAKKENKTNRTGVVHHYLEIFENQSKSLLTDEQIAEAVAKKTGGDKPTTKNVASYRCYFNQGKLAGQKSKPKEALKAVRPKADKKAKAKKPMSQETKDKLKAYTAAKKNGKLKIKKSK